MVNEPALTETGSISIYDFSMTMDNFPIVEFTVISKSFCSNPIWEIRKIRKPVVEVEIENSPFSSVMAPSSVSMKYTFTYARPSPLSSKIFPVIDILCCPNIIEIETNIEKIVFMINLYLLIHSFDSHILQNRIPKLIEFKLNTD